MKSNYVEGTYLFLRVLIGLLFFQSGLSKLVNPPKVAEMLIEIGFPAPTLFAWILIFSEIIFGLAILIGFKVKYSIWPLVIILIVAISMVSIPGALKTGNWNSTIFNFIILAGLLHIAARGPGIWAVSKN